MKQIVNSFPQTLWIVRDHVGVILFFGSEDQSMYIRVRLVSVITSFSTLQICN